MKYSIVILGALAAATTAQDLSQLPVCGQTCIQNMVGKAGELGCSGTDPACLCKNVNFGYGVRDCSYQSCPSADDAAKVVAYGVEYCRQAGVVVTTGAVGTATGTAAASSGAASGGSGGAGGAGGSSETATGDATAIATSTIETVVTSGGSTFTTQVPTTIFGIGGIPGATSIPATAVTTAPIVSTIVSDGSTILSTIGSSTGFSTLVGGAASSALSSQAADASSEAASVSSALSSATSQGFAAQQTAAPVGLLAAAGLAALLL